MARDSKSSTRGGFFVAGLFSKSTAILPTSGRSHKPIRKNSNPSLIQSHSAWRKHLGLIFVLLVLVCMWNVHHANHALDRVHEASEIPHEVLQDEATVNEEGPPHDALALAIRPPVTQKPDQALNSVEETFLPIEESVPPSAESAYDVAAYAVSLPPLQFSDGPWTKIKSLHELQQYECLSWRRTNNCSPTGKRIPQLDQKCSRKIRYSISGYCEVRHKVTGELRRVLPVYCHARAREATFSCDQFQTLVGYNLMALEYAPKVALSYDLCQRQLLEENGFPILTAGARDDFDDPDHPSDDAAANPVDFSRGIAIVVYEQLFLSVYASIRWLRHTGCTLPIELWYLKNETNTSHPILKTLTKDYGAYLREIKDLRATKFYTKIYAVFYSAFDQVLLLDADNFAVRDPTYLFETIEYKATGAIFWPDFWRPNRTIFGMTSRSMVWEFFGIPFVDMFEQESGQVMINRKQHVKAMHALLHYGLTEPHYPANFRLLWGDKDLFRFAWMRTNSTFHMIKRPAGSAGLLWSSALNATSSSPISSMDPKDAFCGQTMVQHDPSGDIMFLHRNMQKLSTTNHNMTWTHIQQLKPDQPIGAYDVRGVIDKDRFPHFRKCYGKFNQTDAYLLTPLASLPYATIESQLIAYVIEGDHLIHDVQRPSPSPALDEDDPLLKHEEVDAENNQPVDGETEANEPEEKDG